MMIKNKSNRKVILIFIVSILFFIFISVFIYIVSTNFSKRDHPNQDTFTDSKQTSGSSSLKSVDTLFSDFVTNEELDCFKILPNEDELDGETLYYVDKDQYFIENSIEHDQNTIECKLSLYQPKENIGDVNPSITLWVLLSKDNNMINEYKQSSIIDWGENPIHGEITFKYGWARLFSSRVSAYNSKCDNPTECKLLLEGNKPSEPLNNWEKSLLEITKNKLKENMDLEYTTSM